MRLRNITGSREMIAANEYVIHDETACKGRWAEVFGNDRPIRLEIGTGKGRFLTELAAANPDVDYLGIEKYSSVLLRAVQKMEEPALPNLRFIRMDAEYICDVFAKGEIDRIYLNFSDPWPKDRHAKRRLPSRQFLERYAQILKEDGLVEFKTDNTDLFDFALEELKESAFELVSCTRDLHKDPLLMQGNVMTEYEEKFSSRGNPICKYVIRLKKAAP
ncbi:MAG: tRNA (guanosine(46)-N7)-methyltransferase TrmB [Lachnospiraceae bacterium]|nr:tRNA (guanosine(46)-N7)-methyltransferase TrmB [Lachnospiraceae bacterium]